MTYRDQQAAMLQSIENGFREGRTPSTFVKISKTYETDTDYCLTNAVFVPELAETAAYTEMMDELRALNEGHYLYPSVSLHTTIKNVRTIHEPPLFTEEDIECIRPALRQIAAQYQSFEIDWQGLLALPTSLAIKGLSAEAYGHLVGDLHQALIDVGVPDNKAYASSTIFANIATCCRYTHPPSDRWNEVVQRWKSTSFGVSHIKSFSLVVCNAVVAPASLRVVETFPFKG